jgi:hypothetical protein
MAQVQAATAQAKTAVVIVSHSSTPFPLSNQFIDRIRPDRHNNSHNNSNNNHHNNHNNHKHQLAMLHMIQPKQLLLLARAVV